MATDVAAVIKMRQMTGRVLVESHTPHRTIDRRNAPTSFPYAMEGEKEACGRDARSKKLTITAPTEGVWYPGLDSNQGPIDQLADSEHVTSLAQTCLDEHEQLDRLEAEAFAARDACGDEWPIRQQDLAELFASAGIATGSAPAINTDDD